MNGAYSFSKSVSVPLESTPKKRFRLLSVVGTYLKPEMHTIYRQLHGLDGIEHFVATECPLNLDVFPFPNIITIEKVRGGRKSGRLLAPDAPNSSSFSDVAGYYSQYLLYRKKVAVGNLLRKLSKRGINLFDVLGLESLKPLSPHESLFDLRKIVDSVNPDLIHVYFGNKATGYLWQLKEIDVPWVVSFHGADVSKNMHDPVYASNFKEMCDAATLIAARSKELMKELQCIGCSPNKLRLSRSSIPVEDIPHSPRVFPVDGKWRIIQACRLIQKKGLMTSLEAFKLLLGEFPHAEFLICGTGPLEADLMNKIRDLGISESVKLLGRVSISRLLELYSTSHIFLHPSEITKEGDREGVPNALLEAMATGMPYVSTYHGGIPEVLTDGCGGKLVPERSPEMVCEALRLLMVDESFYNRCSYEARSLVEDKFSLSNNIACLESIYDEAITASFSRMKKSEDIQNSVLG